MQKAELREIEWASPKKTSPPLPTIEKPVEKYGQMANGPRHLDELPDGSRADAFMLQEDGKLRCPAGSNLWLSTRPSRECFY
jgi:hypothetical protein